MFETELMLWLQSFSSRWLTATMVFLTDIGVTRTYVMLAIIVTFGFDFRVGFMLFQFVLWNGAVTTFLKAAFALPRPAEIDAAVALLEVNSVNDTPLEGADGDHFFDLPEPEAIEYYRNEADATFGFPSGHVSTATTFWVGSAFLRRSWKLMVFGLTYVALMAISRMYLGRHFLADVLGGFLVGLMVVLGLRFILRTAAVTNLLRTRSIPTSWEWWRKAGLAAVFICPPLLLFAQGSDADFDSVGRLLAANIAFAILFLRGLPMERNTPLRRLGRMGIALVLWAATREIVKALTRQPGIEDTAWDSFVFGFAPPLVFLLGTVWLGSLLGLYSQRVPAEPRSPSTIPA